MLDKPMFEQEEPDFTSGEAAHAPAVSAAFHIPILRRMRIITEVYPQGRVPMAFHQDDYCRNCDGRKCMGCVFREHPHDCADDCPDCCV